ncbi:37S ribosomal protein mrp4 [Physcia stellaris]|nr:37S ribosomal protein mrp4 [Physcia stellaris]
MPKFRFHKDREIGTRLSAEAAQETGRDINPALNAVYNPQSLIDDPPRPEDVTLEMLLAAQCHLGHHTSLWNPMNSRYIFGIRQGIHVISLESTAAHLRRACRIIQGVAERGGLILFVGTREGQDRCVVNAAKRAGACHLFERWTPGALTNGHQILGNCKIKVVDEFDREVPGYGDKLKDMPSLKPDLVVCLNPLENWVMLHECGMNAVPTIGIVDTDANPTWVTYPIPANDDSMRSVQLIAGVLGRAGEEGRAERFRMAARGEVLYTASRLEPPGKTMGMATGGSANEMHGKEAGVD